MLNSIVLAAGEAAAAQQTAAQTAQQAAAVQQTAAKNAQGAAEQQGKTGVKVPPPQQGQQGQQAQPQGNPWSLLVPIVIVLVVMTFLSGRSQRKQREKQQKMFAAIVKGTRVRTIGGFTGKVVEVRDETLLIELADKMPPVEILKNAVATILDETKTEEVKK